ncbi:hypothetical protein CBP36_19970 (plasmid) [Acidovorax carolinensis]|uniref:Methyl-accepting transducer domain-containing protein n=1 Tax=Acidovorax carolinensis TaxID=553814 RepID=A0A240UJE9_9BURK|nr:methyl-accepting chemotaxis protein [Acidovorax carolinensis]ART57188.1 hypothetical protein CBP35_19940 [Acidovorax carolinensis]ART61246.1 hypothetical protein CBP36_19970 [Acidovorax carolinensis]
MSNPGKKIHVASFSFGDVARITVGYLALGAVFIVFGALIAWIAGINRAALSDAQAAGWVIKSAAEHAENGILKFNNGGAYRLSSAADLLPQARRSLAALQRSAGSTFADPSLQRSSIAAFNDFSALERHMRQLEPALLATGAVNQAMGESSPQISALAKAVRESGRNARAAESLARLAAYGESGIGLNSIRWIDYEVRGVMSELSGTEWGRGATYLQEISKVAAAAVAIPITREQLVAVKDAAKSSASSAAKLESAASANDTVVLLVAVGAGLSILGLCLIAYAIHQIVDDFGRRYHRGVQQFRGGEAGRKSLIDELGSISNSESVSLSVSEIQGDLAEVARLINHIGERQGAHLDMIHSTLSTAQGNEEAIGDSLRTLDRHSIAVKNLLQASSSAVGESINVIQQISMDAHAAAHAAEQASDRASDANRVAEDASSRMDALRDGLQETSKGIKRLGERTQEINSVVDTMEQISEQVGVLALNASLEAERAGESGAGFRLVAKEVQSLARRSEEALVRISSLVQGAQADARTAAEAVERSTSFVVTGSNVSAVSHALLVSLSPVVSAVQAMANGIQQRAREGETHLEESSKSLNEAATAAMAVSASIHSSQGPLDELHKRLVYVSQVAQG